jgi:nitrile hydratase subunit alpha
VHLQPNPQLRPTAETRYMVLPMRPEGTEDWSRERLERAVTKECLIGTAIPSASAD